MTLDFWICALITLVSAMTSFGFSLNAFKTSVGESGINAMYTTARSLALVLASIAVFFNHSRSWLITVAVIMIIVQVADSVIGIKIHNKMKTFGPAITAIFNFIALIWLVN
ncbi:hypothetical protein BH10PAT3_BH10PAT3_1560 [soil metagenome]